MIPRRTTTLALVCVAAFAAGAGLGFPRVARSKLQCGTSAKNYHAEKRALTLVSVTIDGRPAALPAGANGSITTEHVFDDRLELESPADGDPSGERHLQRGE